MSFSPGHPFVWECMRTLSLSFKLFQSAPFEELIRSGVWGNNGPKLVTQVLKGYAGDDVEVMASRTFFLVSPTQILDLFKNTLGGAMGFKQSLLDQSVLGVHLWNQVSKDA